jgi:cytochrome c peroxidase
METSRLSRLPLFVATMVAVSIARTVVAQGPPPPPPLQPLAAPVAPAGNPITTDKTQLGKALFWDEQLSSTRTVACGTCHQPVAGGSDPRSTPTTLHPGPNGTFGNADDIVGSPGVIATNAAGLQQLADFFGIAQQVTGRYSPSAINSAYPPELFWDGRATGTFTDPVSGQVVLATGAALESQAAGPPASSVEMAHAGRDWTAVASRLEHALPLALSPAVPADLTTWIAGRSYSELFQSAFGSAGVTPSRIIMAIATYERSLVSNQAPIDAFIAGTPGALTAQEQQGLNLFRTNGCVGCHAGNRFTDDAFHYIGVRPQGEDLGRSVVTGVNGNRGQFKTPTLRNVALRGEFMHNGRLETLEDVVEFYDRGGDFDAPNKPPVIQPLGLTDTEKAALVAFLGRPLTDPRVAAESGPFSRPALSAGSVHTPEVFDDAVEDEVGNLPLMTAIEPSLSGSANFTVGLSRVPVGQPVWLVIDDEPMVPGGGVPAEGSVKYRFRLDASGGTSWDTSLGTDHSGFASVAVAIPGGEALDGVTLFGRWFVDGEAGLGESASFEATVFGETAGLLSAPTGLVATRDLLNDTVKLSWNDVPEASRFDVYRSSTDDFVDAVLITSLVNDNYNDDEGNLAEGDYYWVVSVNADEASAPSAVVKADGLSLDGFTINASDGGSYDEVVLSWQQAFPLAAYRVLRGVSPDPASMSPLVETTGTNFNDIDTTPLRTYFYQVELFDDGGELLGRSLVESGYRRLRAPTGVGATNALYQDRIEITWDAVVGAESYLVFRKVGTAEATLVVTVTGTSGVDTGAPAGEPVQYYVQSATAYGNGEVSETKTGRRNISNPEGLTVSLGSNPGELMLAWEASEGAEGFFIFRSGTADFNDAEEVGSTDTTGFVDTTAELGASYHYWVIAADDGGSDPGVGDPVAGVSGSAVADLLVEAENGSYLGDGVVNLSASGQTRVAKIRRWDRFTVGIHAQNDGTLSDGMNYAGIGKNNCVRISCFRTAPTSENLTAALKVGLAGSGDLAFGASESLEIRLQPERGATAKKKKRYRLSYYLRSTSGLLPSAADVVKLNVTAK